MTTANVPTTFSYDITFATSSGDNTLWAQPASSRRYTVGDSLEGRGRNLLVKNAIPFFSAQDPRVPVRYTVATNGKDTTISQDGLIPSRTTTLWARSTTVAAVNGLDARLIEAEGQAQGERHRRHDGDSQRAARRAAEDRRDQVPAPGWLARRAARRPQRRRRRRTCCSVRRRSGSSAAAIASATCAA